MTRWWRTERGLYYFFLWLPLIVPVWTIGEVFHVPFAIGVTFWARRRPTKSLVDKAWWIPPVFSVWCALFTALFMTFQERRALEQLLRSKDIVNAPLMYAALGLAISFGYVALGKFVVFLSGAAAGRRGDETP